MSGYLVLGSLLCIGLSTMLGAALAAFAALGRLWEERPEKAQNRSLTGFIVRDASSVIATWLVSSFFWGLAGVLLLGLALGELFPALPSGLHLLTTTVLGTCLVVLGLIVWKRLAEASPQAFARMAAALSLPTYLLLYPFRKPLNTALERLYPPLAVRAGMAWTTEEISEMAEHPGPLAQDTSDMIQRLVELGGTTIREIMVPRIDMIAVPETASIEEIISVIRDKRHSRFPVYRDNVDNIIGFLHIKDLTANLNHSSSAKWSGLVRKAYFVPETKHVDDLLSEMRARRMHLAIVVDEYGGTAGIVTLEDVIEEVVGEIQDESDKEQPLISRLEDGSFRVDAKVDLDELNERLQIQLESNDVDTLGGFIYGLAGEIPMVGDRFRHEDIEFVISEVAGKRIMQVIVRPQLQNTNSTTPRN